MLLHAYLCIINSLQLREASEEKQKGCSNADPPVQEVDDVDWLRVRQLASL